MKNVHWIHTIGAAWAFVILLLPTALSYGAVTADPTIVTFTSPEQSATIALTRDGVPIRAAEIRGWQFLASGHDYKHMIDVEKMDGALKISPSKTVEVGSFDFSIETAEGSVMVRVLTPLSDLPNVVEKMAAITGLSEKQIAEKLGLASIISEEIQIDLPPVYYEGQTLEMTLPTTPGRDSAWFMNGYVAAKGLEHNSLSYTFQEPGEYVLTYIETENKDGQTFAVRRARAYTRAVSVPGVPVEAAVNTEVTFAPPTGYRNYVWRIDGREFSREAVFNHTFREAAFHSVECLASSPSVGPEQGFLRLRYNTIVK